MQIAIYSTDGKNEFNLLPQQLGGVVKE